MKFDDKEDFKRLQDIRFKMIDLLDEAKNLIRQHAPREQFNRSKHTWINNIDAALGGGECIDTYDHTFEKALAELDPGDEDDYDDEEDLEDPESDD